MHTADVLIVGGGIVGLATGLALADRVVVMVVEAEEHVGQHQTGHNSGVIHSGLYYKPGSAKARTCVEGRELLYRFCEAHGIPHERCGKLVVATHPGELPALAELQRRGTANGLHGLRWLTPEQMREIEPHVAGIAALRVTETGIVNYKTVSQVYAQQIHARGGSVHVHRRFLHGRRVATGIEAETTTGPIQAKLLVNCAGLQSDRVARQCGVEPGVRIVPFRGEYFQLKPHATHLCRHLIYPVPDPRLPFLGVHFTRMIEGGVECGPNAVLAFSREGYRFRDVRLRDVCDYLTYPGFWKMSWKFWPAGLAEMYRSLSRRAFWRSLRKLIPEVSFHDLTPASAGVRAQAVAPDGHLVDDFFIKQTERMIHVLNAPSPAATASLAIGRYIAEIALQQLN
ncbi:MAG: L-2-hydroxyglutarate oxidase [Gemmataceae bacterium]|nr:L-2-hydroxyglutarate oxidase [Gemmata sp.]MDW8199455.1 L-2-hydroxyglutarate oxidase [Gemmataceae bacterium]